jgi:60 kDa SS-A/Ro ribonucleoprotein
VNVDLNPRDSIMTNATKLAAVGGGGTNCSAPLQALNKANAKVDMVVFVSDNQSWMDAQTADRTGMMSEWAKLKRANPQARLVCIDLQPYGTTQAPERGHTERGRVLGCCVRDYRSVRNRSAPTDRWTGEIEKIAPDAGNKLHA